jgi:hypothetical protein
MNVKKSVKLEFIAILKSRTCAVCKKIGPIIVRPTHGMNSGFWVGI